MSNRIKRKMRTVILENEGDRYRFKNGVAVVPGVRFQGKAMKITIEEFEELQYEGNKAV